MAFSPPSRGRLSCTSRLDASSTRGGVRSSRLELRGPKAGLSVVPTTLEPQRERERTTTTMIFGTSSSSYLRSILTTTMISKQKPTWFYFCWTGRLLTSTKNTTVRWELRTYSLSLSLVCVCVCIVYQREKKTEENKESDFFVKFGFLLGTGGEERDTYESPYFYHANAR